MPTVRPLVPSDAEEVLDLMVTTFEDLARRNGREPGPRPAARAPGVARIAHLAASDPGGAWAAEEDGRIIGAALALVREGVWGLSLLVVEPGRQSGGIGSDLLARAVAYGNGARGGIILASGDPRALRAYARAGFQLRPALDAVGALRNRPARPAAVRDGRWPEDRAIVDAASRAVRGATHGDDLGTLLMSCDLLVHERGGFAVHREGTARLLAAHDDAAAADLLRACLSAAPDGAETPIEFITAGQDWAVEVALEAGLKLRPDGALFVRGEVGPLAPYLPSGAYL